MQALADHETTSIGIEMVRQLPAIIGAIFAGVAMILGIRNGAKATAIKTMVDGHASAAAEQLKALHEEVVRTQEKRVEDVKQAASQTAAVSAAVAPDPSKPQAVVIVDRRKE